MTALTHHVAEPSGGAGKSLLEAFLGLQTPEGFRAELIAGEIIVTPPPDGGHETVIGRISWQIGGHCAKTMDFAGGKGLIVPTGRFIPDGTVTTRGAMASRGSWSRPESVLMVLEVTSNRPEKDREVKRTGYAAAEIPLYLLVDREPNRITLYSDPQRGDYRGISWVKVGEPLELPDPFGFTLDTGDLF